MVRPPGRPARHDETEHHAGDRRMHPGQISEVPGEHSEHDQRDHKRPLWLATENPARPGFQQAAGQPEQSRSDGGETDELQLGILSEEKRDDQDGHEVVEHGECEQEHPHASRDASAEDREHAKGEGDVSCGRYRPAGSEPGASCNEQIDTGWDHDAAKGGQGGQRRFP